MLSHLLWRSLWLGSAVTMDTISLLMIGCGIVTFAGLQVVPAYYGRYANQAPAWLGFIGQAIPAPRLTWILQEVPTVVAWFYFFGSQAIMVLSAGKQWPSPNLLLSLLFLLHYVHRSGVLLLSWELCGV